MQAFERVLTRSGLTPGSNAARLLRYVVEETAEGRAERLKAITIGQDVFHRGADFDPSRDSIVRVEMKRLREILDHYYATSGEGDPLQISIPKGTYIPQLVRSSAPVREAAPTVATPARPHGLPRIGLVLLLLTVLGMAGILSWTYLGGRGASGEGQPSLRIVAAGGTSNSAYATASAILSRFRNIDLVAVDPATKPARQADYELVLTPISDATLAQLRVEETGDVISSQVFADADFAGGADLGEYTSFQVWLGRAASRNGMIESDYVRRGAYSGDFTCSVLTEAYFTDQTDAHHLEARDCILSRLSEGHDSARLRIDLALLYREEQSDQRNLMPGDPLERAMREAQAAIALDRFDSNAYYALMTVHFASGAVQEGIAMGERSLELNPFDGEAVGGFAARINYVGEHERALALFDAASELTPGGVNWRDYGYFLAHLGLDNPKTAASIGIGLRGIENELYLAAVAISASIRGDTALAVETKRALLEREPDPRWMYERRAYAPDLVESLMRHLDAIEL